LKALQNKDIPGDCFLATMLSNPEAPGLLLLEEDAKSRGFIHLDVVFPVLHGPYGEDGTVQGLLELTGIPYVGAGVLSSAVSMDKAVMKLLFQQRGLPVGDFLFFRWFQWAADKYALVERIEKKLGYPCFVKPANLGSSVGINKATCRGLLMDSIEEALRYDQKVVVEAFIPGREIECSVLGDDEPAASVPGEIIPGGEFYDYRAKYLDDTSQLLIPAPLKPEVGEKIQAYAKEAFLAVECSGLGRVDFFYQEEDDKIFVNEINTIPGFTSISMYPKLWEASGLSFSELIDRLIRLALERHRRKQSLLTKYIPFAR